MRNILIATLFIPFLTACHTDKVSELTAKLEKLDKAMNGAEVTDKAKAEEFISTSEELAKLVEKDDKNRYVDLILKAAGLAKTIEKPKKAIELYQLVAEKLPKHPKAPTALFMIGFVYENDLNDIAKARVAYESFLDKYPDDPDFADDAKTSLNMLGKSPEEIIKQFEQNPQ